MVSLLSSWKWPLRDSEFWFWPRVGTLAPSRRRTVCTVGENKDLVHFYPGTGCEPVHESVADYFCGYAKRS